MKSQIPRESQSPSFQTGQDSARTPFSASGMPFGPIRGDYRVRIGGVSGESREGTSDSAMLFHALQKHREESKGGTVDSAAPMTEEEICKHIEKGWNGQDFKAAEIFARQFTDVHVKLCIKKGWGAQDFLDLGFTSENFTEEIIYYCLTNGWKKEDFKALGIGAERFTKGIITTYIKRGGKGRDFEDAGIPGTDFTEKIIYYCLTNGWKKEDFKALGIGAERFTKGIIATYIKKGGKGRDFKDAGIPGTDFTEKIIYYCLTNGWKKEDFKTLGIGVERFTERIITGCIERGWKGRDFKDADIPGANFTEDQITACIEKGWSGWHFEAVGIDGAQLTTAQITLCIKQKWEGKAFQAAGVPGTKFIDEHILFCIKEVGWRGKDFKAVDIFADRIKKAGVTVNDLVYQYGWERKDFGALTFAQEEFKHFSAFEQSYVCPKEMLRGTDSKLPGAKEYSESYQKLYQSRKETNNLIDWNIPEIEEGIDTGNATEKINNLSNELNEQLKTKLVQSRPGLGSGSLYGYTMHVDPHEATLVYCIKAIVDRVVADLTESNIPTVLPKFTKLYSGLRDYINENNEERKKGKKENIIEACGEFLLLLEGKEEVSELSDLISFVKELEETFDEDRTFALKASGDIDDYKEIDPSDETQHDELFQQNIFNRHETMKKTLNNDDTLGHSYDAYTFNSPRYNPLLQTFLEPIRDEGRKPCVLKYWILRNAGLHQMSCMCSKIDKNIKVYRYIEYHRDPLLQICGYQTEGNTLTQEEIMDRLKEAKKEGIQLEDPAFMSTGFQPVPSYAREVMMVICCPKGTPMYITNFANDYKEVVLPRHTQLKILEVEDAKGVSAYGEKCQIVLTVEVTGVGL